MAPALTEVDKDPDSPRALVEEGAAPPLRPCRIAQTLTALLKSNLKNLLADCGGQTVVRGANGASDFSASDVGAMKNVLGEQCNPSDGIMDCGEPKQQDDMGLHSANSSNLQELLNNKKQLAEPLLATSPTPDLADMIREFESVAQAATLPSGNGNGDVPADELQMITNLVTSMDEVAPAAPDAAPAPAPAAAPVTAEAARARQAQVESRSAGLLRRVRALEVRSARRQSRAQVAALLARLSAARSAQTTATSASAAAAAAAPQDASASGVSEVLLSPNGKQFSTTQLVNLVLNNKTASASAPAAAPPPPPPPPLLPPESATAAGQLERDAAAAAARPAGVARRQLARLTAAEDSDATESSSGGESGDEFDHGWDDAAQERAAPIRKRALWRWMTERSGVACRWSWLSAQVTDLEFRIRQLRELHRQLRATNPRAAALRSSSSASSRQVAARELGGAGDASSAALRDATKASDAEAAAGAGPADDGQCARTRRWPSIGRRRVFSVTRAPRRQAGGLVARCRCDPGDTVCATCAGRLDYAPHVRPETQPARDRLALLDATYHPVLSFAGEAALSLSYDALLRSCRWQQNHLLARPRGPRVVTKEAGDQPSPATPAGAAAAPAAATTPVVAPAAPAGTTPCSRPSFHRRKSGLLKRLPELAAGDELAVPAGSNGRLGRPPKVARRSRSSSAGGERPVAPRDARPAAGAGDEPAWPGRQSPERRESRERPPPRYRHRQLSYDIDNIVIPASMASTAKIEKPKYKEIVTPGWRTVELSAAAVNGQAAAPDPPEPLDDAAYEQRHLAAELAERRRLYQSCQSAGGATAAAAGPGHGRGRRAHTPDVPPTAEPGAADRPRVLRYEYLAEPCGFPARQFPLSERQWKELLSESDNGARSPLGWLARASPAGSSTESAPETEEHRLIQ